MRTRFRKRRHAPMEGEATEVELFFGENEVAGHNPAADRKLRQLCREAYRVLSGTALLDWLEVIAVEPAPDASRLAVIVRVPSELPVREALELLARRRGELRDELAQAVQRKRAPELAFEVVP